MASLHPDPRSLGDLRTGGGGREGTGVGDPAPRCAGLHTRRGLGGLGLWGQRVDRAPLQPEPGAEREGSARSAPILKLDEVDAAGLLHPRHRTDPARRHVFEDHADLDVDRHRARAPSARPVTMRVVGEDVRPVRICCIHPEYSSGVAWARRAPRGRTSPPTQPGSRRTRSQSGILRPFRPRSPGKFRGNG